MPRKDLSLSEKIAILDKIKSQPTKISHRQLAEIVMVPKSTISRLLQQQEKLREEWTSYAGLKKATHKRKRKGKDPDVENALNQWFTTESKLGVYITGSMLKAKSEELAKKLGHVNFKATDGWLSRWKCRHGIRRRKVQVEDNESAKAIQLIDNSWQGIIGKTIHNCFTKNTLTNCNSDAVNCTETDMALELENVQNCEKFLKIDLQCDDENEDHTQPIDEQIMKKHLETSNDQENDDNEGHREMIIVTKHLENPKNEEEEEDGDDLSKQVTNEDAKKCIAKLRCYFMQECNKGSPLSALNTCAEFVQLQSMKSEPR